MKYSGRFSDSLRETLARRSLQQGIAAHGPYAWFITINFSNPYPDEKVIHWTNEIIRRLNCSLFKEQFAKRKEGCWLTGLCSVEVCRGGGRLDNCLHFHILIKHCKKVAANNFGERLKAKVVKYMTQLKDGKRRAIGNDDTVYVVPYQESGKGPSYFTKEFEERRMQANDFICLLGPDGLAGLNIPKNRKKLDLLRIVTE